MPLEAPEVREVFPVPAWRATRRKVLANPSWRRHDRQCDALVEHLQLQCRQGKSADIQVVLVLLLEEYNQYKRKIKLQTEEILIHHVLRRRSRFPFAAREL